MHKRSPVRFLTPAVSLIWRWVITHAVMDRIQIRLHHELPCWMIFIHLNVTSSIYFPLGNVLEMNVILGGAGLWDECSGRRRWLWWKWGAARRGTVFCCTFVRLFFISMHHPWRSASGVVFLCRSTRCWNPCWTCISLFRPDWPSSLNPELIMCLLPSRWPWI